MFLFLSPSLRAPHYGLRVSLVLSEIQKERGLYRDLTQLYIKMTAEVSHFTMQNPLQAFYSVNHSL